MGNVFAWLSKLIVGDNNGIVPLQEKPLALLGAGGGAGDLQLRWRQGYGTFIRMPAQAKPPIGRRIWMSDPPTFDLSTGTLTSERDRKKIDNFIASFLDGASKEYVPKKKCTLS